MHFLWASWYGQSMDDGWSVDTRTMHDDNRRIVLKALSLWRFTLGTMNYCDIPYEGYWFLYLRGIRWFGFTGKW